MNILTDFHHGDLYYSLQLLFEKRLGWNLFRPIGLEWFSEGYWRYSQQGDTVKQFLGLDQGTLTPERRHNEKREIIDGVYYVWDSVHQVYQKAVTLESFKEMPFGIVISSVSQHDETFNCLVNDWKPSAKRICHIGNIFQGRQAGVKNLLVSTRLFPVDSNTNAVFYHQEFNVSVYSFVNPTEKKSIKCFMNCLPQLFPDDYAVYNELKKLLPGYEFKSYGGSCDDGSLHTDQQIAHEMQESRFGFHCKKLGDGFGHVIHNWFAVGRPVITRVSDYADKLAGDLLVDGVTCFDIDKHSLEEIAKYIHEMTDDEYRAMCQSVHKRFTEVVNFNDEFTNIQTFLDRLL